LTRCCSSSPTARSTIAYGPDPGRAGLPSQDTLPEKGSNGNGTVTDPSSFARGQLLKKYDGTTTFNLRGLDGALLREVELKAGAYEWVKDYIYRDGLLLASQHRTEGHQHYHLDHPGTTRMLTNRCGERVKRYEQFPYGDTISAPANDTETRRFTGHQRDLGSPTNTTDDLEYMHARYYGVKMGRLLSVDPALELKKSKRQPQRWNGYAYVLGNPLVFTDPTGELVYVVIYTQGNSVGDDEFKRAALTRANEIRKEKGFDPEKDTVLVQGVTTKADFAGVIDQANGLADTYGQVKEVSLYSHAGPQHGPTFHGSSWRFFTGQELDTLKVNWAPGASAHFYGCNTGQNFSAAFAASQHVTTYGQPRYSYFSGSPSERIPIAPRGPVYLYPAPLSGRATHTTSAMITRGRRRGCGNGGASGASSAVSTAGMGGTMSDTDTRNGNGSGLPEDIQRWTAKRRAALVMSILRGETTVVEAARKHDLTVADIEHWKDAFLLGAENALRSRPKDEEALQQEQIKKLERKVGQLVMALDIAREAMKLRPFPEPTSDA